MSCHVSSQGVAEVDPDPIPSLLAQSVIHAVESMSLLLVSALANDPTGTAQHHLIAAMCALLSLELGLKGHNDILKSCLATPKGTITTAFLVSPSGGLHRRGITVSASLASMAAAVDAAIVRLLDGYSDVLDAYVFPEQYANALKSRAT